MQSFWGVWLGSTVGMMLADGIAIVVGAVLGKRLPEKLITRVAGVIFIVFGVAELASAFFARA
jgi:putative Ca2+/H+ antiporter (TMEM165/GDT1 family)